jgi:enoyl-CoA hydratase/carnithine racemase
LSETFVSYAIKNGVAEIRMDDGRRNALGPALLRQFFEAVEAGWVDETVPEDEIIDRARVVAQRYASLPAPAFARTKKQSRRILADTVRKMMERGSKGSDVFSPLRP